MEIFNADRQRNIEINNLLQRIKYKASKQEVGSSVFFPMFSMKDQKFKNEENPANQLILDEIKKMGAIEIDKRTDTEINETLRKGWGPKNKEFIIEGYWVKPIEPLFSRLCSDYEKRVNNQGKSETRIKADVELYLEPTGDFWREPKIKYCYPMGANSDRYKIVLYLTTNKGYQPTVEISVALNNKNPQSIRTEIGKIRNNIRKYLKIEGEKVIEKGKKDSGYRIGSAYKIKVLS